MRILVACLIILGVLSPLIAAAADTDSNLGRLLPGEVAGWRPTGQDRIFTREDIFEYLDGGGEVYLAYTFRRLLVREYTDAANSSMVAEIYDMSSAADAYGIFSNDPDGEEVRVGREALYGGGLLRFWKGPFFVRLLAEKETGETKPVLLGLGARIAAAISEEGLKPRLLSCLPTERLDRKSVRYFHKQVSLNTHYYLADENVLLLDESSEVALAKYRSGWSRAMLLICRYRTPAKARSAHLRFGRDYFGGKTSPQGRTIIDEVERGEFAASRLVNNVLILVFESPDRATCETLVRSAETKIQEVFHGQ